MPGKDYVLHIFGRIKGERKERKKEGERNEKKKERKQGGTRRGREILR